MAADGKAFSLAAYPDGAVSVRRAIDDRKPT
jgi:hypothetical protein